MDADRRLEAENYLSSGYGIRLAFESRRIGWRPLVESARTWQPSRLKGILVRQGEGTPFLAATQVFDMRPIPRKFIALEKTPRFTERYAVHGTILITRSGAVGRSTLTTSAHDGMIISDDLLRVEPQERGDAGWLYAYLRASRTRKMMTSARYGHMIKHLEPEHLNNLPFLHAAPERKRRFAQQHTQLLLLRDEAVRLVAGAEALYAEQFPKPRLSTQPDGFTVRAAQMFGRRRRLDATAFHPASTAVVNVLKRGAEALTPLAQLVDRIFVPGRFKHVYGDDGVPYLDSADILEVCPDVTKYVLSLDEDDRAAYLVDSGWLLIPCSGQVYGNLGHVVLSTEWHVGKVISNHVLRVVPRRDIRVGYLQCALGHPTFGRPQVVRFAFGSSVPELAAEDVGTVLVPRLARSLENRIADAMERAAIARAEADIIELEMGLQADSIIAAFLEEDYSALAVE